MQVARNSAEGKFSEMRLRFESVTIYLLSLLDFPLEYLDCQDCIVAHAM